MGNREQKLVDIIFECVMIRHMYKEKFDDMSREEMMEWVARQLRGCGFNTQPIGSSWGVLCDNSKLVTKRQKTEGNKS